MENLTLLIFGLGAAAAISWFLPWEKSTVPAIIGSKGFVSSYMAALHYLYHAEDVIQQGYSRYRERAFRVPTLSGWDYVANGIQHVEEIAVAPEHVLSLAAAFSDNLQADYTMGPEVIRNPYDIAAVRTSLTRNLGRCFPEVRDEIVCSFDEVLSLVDEDWKELDVRTNIVRVIARTSNRLFVGLPLCRDKEYLDLVINYTHMVVGRGKMIRILPDFLKPIFGPLLSTRKTCRRHALKLLGPIIEERLENERENGRDWPDRPHDLISWLLDFAQGEERTPLALVQRILGVNMTAIETSFVTLTAALYALTTYPEHILPMREEAERVVAEKGWSKASISNMHKIDSFLRESQRLNGAGPVMLTRKVVAKGGFTFSDGTKIPYGSLVSIPGAAIHCDPENYQDAATFDGFRFSRERTDHGETNEHPSVFSRYMVSTAHDHVAFGYGNHACPGRFFAAAALKTIIAHLLIHYDVKAGTEGRGKIMIRKRA
ncbi:cytochrome P450 [Mycena rosella]|uniref:Cytochrome P450 n=1 Tax=Mycena rosella TaxID=1033263 RepID=A0AAD7GD23_MYCRO|nr:cytochrome P450 [Mycena rosella]